MSILKNSKCQICKVRRQQRFCLRKGKDICWECCNNMRYDRQCPKECRYSVKAGEGLQISKTNADSLTEYKGLIEKLMDLWMRMPQQDLNGSIPEELSRSQEGRSELINYFKKTNLSKYINLSYIKRILDLEELEIGKEKESNEDVGKRYLSSILAGDMEGSLAFHVNGEEIKAEPEWLEDYLSQLKGDKILGKMTDFKIISSALSEDRNIGLGFYDINGKYDLCLKIVKSTDSWKVASRYNGKMEIVNGENEALRHIAVLISKSELSQAVDLLDKYIALYPDSSDLYYYQGVISAMKGKNKQAKKSFLCSIRLDPGFSEALYNYGLQLHLEGDIQGAADYYKRVLAIEPEEVKSLNNLAAIYIDLQEYQSAEEYINRCKLVDPDYEPLLANIKRLNENK
ncbi:MAG: tetratricopeptide repeat protein [Candidatus Stygibacter australis]|nr:tetratricopeptide repeat protein [Candidatus Stygibacter australis]MDP8322606.1 tetratricopeptide repeat protein [Candidatus Stygibacter australis]